MKTLEHFQQEVNIFAKYFEKRYFDKNLEDSYWVADVVGDTFAIADYFFSLNDMMEFVRHDYSEEDMFKYYGYAVNTYGEGRETVCIRDWRKLN